MDFTYKVLWCDDDESWYGSIRSLAGKSIEKSTGLTPEINFVTSLKDALAEDLNVYDLFLVDFNLDSIDDLNKNNQGDNLIEAIREKKIYTTIIFYSASEINDLRNAIHDRKLDGVYVTSRSNNAFLTTLEGVASLSIHKMLDMHNIRGLFISGVADIEQKMKSNLLMACECENLMPSDRVDKYREKYIKDIENKIKKDLNHIGSIHNLSELVPLRSFDLKKKAILIQRFINAIDSNLLNDIQDLGQKDKNYEQIFSEDIADLRNAMAHQTESEFEQFLLNQMRTSRDVITALDYLIEIKRRIEKHQNFMEKFRAALEARIH